MADRLRELGFELDDSPLEARREAGKPIGRPHLADAVLAHPANAQRLRDEGITGRDALFPPYLVPGAPAYVARSRPTVAQAIEVIHAAGGVAVWAHPFWDLDRIDEALATLARFADAGLDGVEVFYATHGEEQTRVLYEAAAAARAADHRLGRLPRPRARALQRVPRLRALRARAGPGAYRGSSVTRDRVARLDPGQPGASLSAQREVEAAAVVRHRGLPGAAR